MECGRANSRNIEEITISGVKKLGDTDGVMKVWLKHETDIDFVPRLQHPVSDGGYAYKHTHTYFKAGRRIHGKIKISLATVKLLTMAPLNKVQFVCFCNKQ